MKNNKLVLKDTRNIAIVYRIHTPQAVTNAKSLTLWLKEQGYNVFTAPEQKLIPGTTQIKTKKQFDQICLVVVLGGDGTYLRAVRLLAGRQIPILGFNMGSLGFLTVHSADDIRAILQKTLQNKMVVQHRAMIHAEVYRKGKLRGSFHALNDVVIERGSYSQLINIAIYLEKMMVSEIKGDGIIFASPMGSTAYNLAAGGPILEPEVNAFVMTPVSPHSLTSRPLLFPDHRKINLRLEGKSHQAHFVTDGQKQLEITNDDEIVLQKSQFDHLVVRAPNFNYFHLLREKLKFGDRA